MLFILSEPSQLCFVPVALFALSTGCRLCWGRFLGPNSFDQVRVHLRAVLFFVAPGTLDIGGESAGLLRIVARHDSQHLLTRCMFHTCCEAAILADHLGPAVR